MHIHADCYEFLNESNQATSKLYILNCKSNPSYSVLKRSKIQQPTAWLKTPCNIAKLDTNLWILI